jgi:hypothetical protein
MEQPEFLKNFGVTKKPFRVWLNKLYFENQKEREMFNDNYITLKEYFNTNKWYLKNKYKQEINS